MTRKHKHENKETALIVVEQPPAEIPAPKPPPVYPTIKTNDVVALKRKGLENAPDADVPFWLVAKDGLYLHRRNILGRGIIKHKFLPKHLPLLDLADDSYFGWEATKIPADICAKIVSFFRNVFKEHKTEAEVILLMNYETLEWDVYVPLQKVSYTSVESVVNPADIPEKFLIVGSMHSHCDFGAFHSSTDMGDASDMDGAHLTLGHLDEETIEVAAMVMLNGEDFTYGYSDIADFSLMDTIDAPAEWYEKIKLYDNDLTDEEKELFVKFGKKRVFTPPKPITPHSWVPSTKTTQPYTPKTYDWRNSNDDVDYEDGWWNYRDWAAEQAAKKKAQEGYWEDYLNDKLVDAIMDSPIFTEEDLNRATDNPAYAQDIQWWRSMFLVKLSQAVSILDKLGMVVEYSARVKEVPKKIAESTTTMEVKNDDLLPEEGDGFGGISLADRLVLEGFEVLEVKEDGTVVIDVAKV